MSPLWLFNWLLGMLKIKFLILYSMLPHPTSVLCLLFFFFSIFGSCFLWFTQVKNYKVKANSLLSWAIANSSVNTVDSTFIIYPVYDTSYHLCHVSLVKAPSFTGQSYPICLLGLYPWLSWSLSQYSSQSNNLINTSGHIIFSSSFIEMSSHTLQITHLRFMIW